jgi:TolB-like protein/Tfp pilus assembly protein PilF
MNSFIEELKRRNVIRVGIAYLAVAWLILQVAEMLLPVYGFTDAAIRNLVAALAVGLLITLGLSWAFEWTPAGIVRESDTETSAPQPTDSHKRFDRFVIFLLVLAVAFFGVDKFVLDPARDAEEIQAATERGRADALEARENDKSVAVLPFANRSSLDDDVYFVDGIHDDILTQLARITALTVTSRTSVERYRGTEETIKDIGTALNVRAILEGGVQRAGDRVRINLQLIDAATDDHLWAQTYVRDLTAENIFAVQAEIATAVAEALRATLLPEEQLALQTTPTASIEAYDLYLLGRYHWNKNTKEAIDIARGHFEEAIEQDPDYVLALSGLADSYTSLVIYGNMTGDDAYPLAQAAIDRAMAIDDSVSEVWASLGYLRYEQRALAESAEAFRRAIQLDDRNFSAWYWYTNTLRLGRQDTEALAAMQRAVELEPMSYLANERIANMYDVRGDFVRAIQHYDRADQLDDKETSLFPLEIAWSYLWAGEYARAIDVFRNILADQADSVSAMQGLSAIYLAMGDYREAELWNDRAAAISVLYREGHRILEARQNYAGAKVYWEQRLQREAPRRELGTLYNLFRINYVSGDIEAARTWLAELVESLDGRIEVHPRNVRPWRELAIAAFWIAHGSEENQEPERGRAIATEVRDGLTPLAHMGWNRPDMLGSLAAAHALLGEPTAAIDRLSEAIEAGFKNQVSALANPAFDSIRDLPEYAQAIARMDELTAQDKIRLADLQLAPYVPPVKREPVAVARELLERYVGWYSDGNALMHVYFSEDNRFAGKYGPRPMSYLLALSGDTFYSPAFSEITMRFYLDDSGEATHFEFIFPGGKTRVKRVDAPPPVIQLPRETLARYEGTYAMDTLEGVQDEQAEADVWVAEIYVDDDGTIWIDYDDQPRLEITAFSETEFQLVGMAAQYRFVVDPDTGEVNEFIRMKDGSEGSFYRQ